MTGNDEIFEMLSDCMSRDLLLNEWETEFIGSLEKQLDNNRSLSIKQIDILERIWEKVTKFGGGYDDQRGWQR